MKITWKITESDILAVKSLIEAQRQHEIYLERERNNVLYRKTDKVSRSECWHAVLLGLLTTQQKSGVGSAVDTFLRLTPHPLHLDICVSQPQNLPEYVAGVLTGHGGIRRHDTIAVQIVDNLQRLEADNWRVVSLPPPPSCANRVLLPCFAAHFFRPMVSRMAAVTVRVEKVW